MPYKKRGCDARHPETNQRCTKRVGHYPRTNHGNEKPGYEVEWRDEESAQ